jgi:hypothetical protein
MARLDHYFLIWSVALGAMLACGPDPGPAPQPTPSPAPTETVPEPPNRKPIPPAHPPCTDGMCPVPRATSVRDLPYPQPML